METMNLEITPIVLEWSDWYPWERYKLHQRTNPSSIKVPNQPGVYEARLVDEDEMLTIGKSNKLSRRIINGLVKGIIPHSAGERIRETEDTTKIVVRWAKTDQYSLAEAILHSQHIEMFGRLPKYTKRT
jgi:hypothetical protein